MNFAEALQLMLDGKLVNNPKTQWAATIENNQLIVSSCPQHLNQGESGIIPLLQRRFSIESTEGFWEEWKNPETLILKDLKIGDRFKFKVDQKYHSHVSYKVLQDNRTEQLLFFDETTNCISYNTVESMKNHSVIKL